MDGLSQPTGANLSKQLSSFSPLSTKHNIQEF